MGLLSWNACALDAERLGQVRARAFENELAVAVANYAARADERDACNGHSVVFDGVCYAPDGTPLDQRRALGGPGEQLVLADVDLDLLRAYRAREPWGDAHRRPEADGPLVERGADPWSRRPGAHDGRTVAA